MEEGESDEHSIPTSRKRDPTYLAAKRAVIHEVFTSQRWRVLAHSNLLRYQEPTQSLSRTARSGERLRGTCVVYGIFYFVQAYLLLFDDCALYEPRDY